MDFVFAPGGLDSLNDSGSFGWLKSLHSFVQIIINFSSPSLIHFVAPSFQPQTSEVSKLSFASFSFLSSLLQVSVFNSSRDEKWNRSFWSFCSWKLEIYKSSKTKMKKQMTTSATSTASTAEVAVSEVSVELILVDRNPAVVAEWKKQKAFMEDSRVKIICANLQDVDKHLQKTDTNSSVNIDLSHSNCNLDKVNAVGTYDCLINSGNSFGQMDGGSDTIICEMFGWPLLTRVQESILKYWGGEQPVGTSLLVPLIVNSNSSVTTDNTTDNGYSSKWLVHTPLTRSPAQKVDEKMNSSYLALWGALMTIENAKEELFMAINNCNNCNALSSLSNSVLPTTLTSERTLRVLCLGLGTGMAGGNAEIIAKQMALAWKNYRNRISVTEDKLSKFPKFEVKDAKDGYLIPSAVVDLKTRELLETTKVTKTAGTTSLPQSRLSVVSTSYFTFPTATVRVETLPFASANHSLFLPT